MTQWLKQSVAATVAIGPFVDATDGVTAETALTISQADVRLSKNGAAFAQKGDATAATHMENGYYSCPLSTTDTGTLGRLRLAVNESGALPVWADFLVVPANVWDSLVAGTDTLQADVTQIVGSAVSTSTAQLGVNAVQVAGATPDTAADLADAVWDEATSGHTTAGTTGKALTDAGSAGDPWSTALPGAYGSGTAGKIVGDNLNATVSSRASQTSVDTVDDLLDTELAAVKTDTAAILIDTAEIGAAGAGLTALASAANLATVAAFVDTEIAAILAAVDTEIAAIKSDTAAILLDTGTDGVVIATGGITAAKFGAGAIDAAAVATDAVTEIADGLLNRNLATGTDSGSETVRTVRQALRALRNKVSIAAGVITICKEDDSTASWTGAVTTAAGDPISDLDPTST